MSLKISSIRPKNGAAPRRSGSLFRKVIYLILLLIAVFALYTFYDMRQAKEMSADICKRAVRGMPLEDLLPAVLEKDFKIIRRSEYAMIVPKKGMGRYHCVVSHDGRIITGSTPGFSD